MDFDPAAFAACLDQAEQALDWSAIEPLYCEGDSEGFFSPDRIEAIRDAGLHFAGDLGEKLSPRQRSLYVGAGVAELVPIIFEAVGLRRRVTVHGLASEELDTLGAALASAIEPTGAPVPRVTADPIRPGEFGRPTHVWMVSVLTDPVAFPALHDRLYGRQGGPLAVGGGHPRAERERAAKLLDTIFTGVGPGTLFTTTDEELPLISEAAERVGLQLAVPRTGRLSGIVGDPVRHCGVRPASS